MSIPDSEVERENIPIALDDPQHYLRKLNDRIAWHKASTANKVAVMLGAAVIVALPLHIYATWLAGATPESMANVFDKWYGLMSPLAGAALGAYYASDRTTSRKE